MAARMLRCLLNKLSKLRQAMSRVEAKISHFLFSSMLEANLPRVRGNGNSG